MLERCLAEVRLLRSRDRRGPPGPPPAWNPLLIWNDESERWVLPDHPTGPSHAVTMPEWSIGAKIAAGEVDFSAYIEEQFRAWTKTKLEAAALDERLPPAVNQYRRWFQEINAYMRGESEQVTSELQASIDAVASEMQEGTAPMTLFRGEFDRRHARLQVGEGIPMDSFTSLSRSPAVAHAFGGHDGTFYEVAVAASAPRMEGSRVLQETVLAGGQTLEVLGVMDVMDDRDRRWQYVVGRVR